MPDGSDLEAVEQFHAALLSKEAGALQELLADDAEWHAAGRSAIAGSHKGKDAIIRLVEHIHAASGGTFRPLRADSHDVMASEYHAVLMDRFLAERDEKRLDTHVLFVVVTERGKVKLLLPYFYDQYAWDEFWQ